MEEAFRFFVLRPPQIADTLPDKAIFLRDSGSVLQNRLRDAIRDAKAFSKVTKIAETYRTSDDFVSDWSSLDMPLGEFNTRISELQELSPGSVRDVVDTVFGTDIVSLITQERFTNDWRRVVDSLVSLTIAHMENTPNHELLVRAIRLCRLLEKLAERGSDPEDETPLDDILEQIIALPGDIFPLRTIPPELEQPEETPAVLKKKEQEEALRLVSEYRKAIQELGRARASDYRTPDFIDVEPIREDKEKEEGRIILRFAETAVESPWILSDEAIRKLSASTIEVIQRERIDLSRTPVPELRNKLQSSLMKLGRKAYPVIPLPKLTKIGSKWVRIPSKAHSYRLEMPE